MREAAKDVRTAASPGPGGGGDRPGPGERRQPARWRWAIVGLVIGCPAVVYFLGCPPETVLIVANKYGQVGQVRTKDLPEQRLNPFEFVAWAEISQGDWDERLLAATEPHRYSTAAWISRTFPCPPAYRLWDRRLSYDPGAALWETNLHNPAFFSRLTRPLLRKKGEVVRVVRVSPGGVLPGASLSPGKGPNPFDPLGVEVMVAGEVLRPGGPPGAAGDDAWVQTLRPGRYAIAWAAALKPCDPASCKLLDEDSNDCRIGANPSNHILGMTHVLIDLDGIRPIDPDSKVPPGVQRVLPIVHVGRALVVDADYDGLRIRASLGLPSRIADKDKPENATANLRETSPIQLNAPFSTVLRLAFTDNHPSSHFSDTIVFQAQDLEIVLREGDWLAVALDYVPDSLISKYVVPRKADSTDPYGD